MMHHRLKRMTKEKNQRYHAKVRMLQHYGKQITNYDLDRMAEIYRHSVDTVILVKQSNRIRKALIWYQGEAYPIVYDKTRNQIVTVLKIEYLTPNQLEKYEKFKFRMLNKISKVDNPVIPNSVHFDFSEDEKNEVQTVPTEKTVVQECNHVEINETEDRKLMIEAFDKLPNFF